MKIADMIETIRVRVRNRLAEFEGGEVKIEASCFWHVLITWRFLTERIKDGTLPKGSRVLIQAGSMSWPIVYPVNDDGISPTHFTYKYERNNPDNLILQVLYGALPEMHCWNALMVPNQPPVLIDLTPRYLKHQMEWTCKNAKDMKWLTADPPDYIWGVGDSIPALVYYEPDMAAIATVLRFAVEAKLMTKTELDAYVAGR